MRLGLVIVAALGLLGCASDDAFGGEGTTDDFIDMDTPPGNCSAGSNPCPDPGGSTGVPEGGACIESSNCVEGTYCIAPFVDGEVGDFICTALCIPLMDESSWCADSSACCDIGAVCSTRGLCIDGALDDTGTAESGTGTEGTGTSGTEGTGTSGTAGTSSGTEGTGSSDTGASTGSTGAMEAG